MRALRDVAGQNDTISQQWVSYLGSSSDAIRLSVLWDYHEITLSVRVRCQSTADKHTSPDPSDQATTAALYIYHPAFRSRLSHG